MPVSLDHILIADDDPILRARVVAYFSARHNITVHEAANGIEAIRLVASAEVPYSLILCDLNMPEKDGIEFLTALAGANYKGAIAIVSGEQIFNIEMADILARNSGLNLVATLKKPISNAQFDELVAELSGTSEPQKAIA
jgi:CheY-like chemotaxis protein